MSFEIFDGAGTGASAWAEGWGDRLVEAALVHGAVDWSWHRTSWGVIFEVAFTHDDAWARFRSSVAVESALDAVPDPVNGVIVYRGRGGSAGIRQPRRPRPLSGAGAAALPLPLDEEWMLFRQLTEPLRTLQLGRR
ncbi:MAG TPA: hypothetical protein VFO65_07280 [Acidimicrobiales bacterium]|nr:hypothetical protein [Acidimicrobiales bacterium]